MNGIVLIGHGSLKSASGASMVRIATRLRERGVAPIAEAGFLNYSRPTLAEAIQKCVELGALRLVVQPYFLISGHYVQHDLARDLTEQVNRYPQVALHVAEAFHDHPAMVELVLKRLAEADPALGEDGDATGLLVMAHGTPLEAANAPIYAVTERVMAHTAYRHSAVAFLDCNQPDISTAIDGLVAQGADHIVAMPYFLQFGRHVRDDLPRLLASAHQRHPGTRITQTHHLDYDLLLVDLIEDRVRALSGPVFFEVRPQNLGILPENLSS